MDLKKNIYVIYASGDKAVAHELIHRFQRLEADFNITIWHDDPIYANKDWEARDASRLDQAEIFLLFVSNTFMHSHFVQQNEFKMVIDRYKEGLTTVVPILLDNCPWDTEFNSDDYDFSFKELQVLPDNRKPINEWESTNDAMAHIVEHVKNIIAPVEETIEKKSEDESSSSDENKEKLLTAVTNDTPDDEPLVKSLDVKTSQLVKEDQIALNFEEEIEAQRKAEEQRSILEAEANQKRVAKEEKLKAEIETKKSEALAQIKREEEIAAANKLEEDKKQREAAHARKWAEAENSKKDDKELAVDESDDFNDSVEAPLKTNDKLKNWVLFGIVALLATIGIWFFSDSDKTDNTLEDSIPKVEVINDEDSNTVEEASNDDEVFSASATKQDIGDSYEGGIIFRVDDSGKPSKIAYGKDIGPMTWNDALKAAKDLGDGWRLPTLAELRTMYRTIGQGATNSGKFTDELYWSGTPFDENQARLLRFRDGNSSFHYNSRGTHRKFLFRAVRDFKE